MSDDDFFFDEEPSPKPSKGQRSPKQPASTEKPAPRGGAAASKQAVPAPRRAPASRPAQTQRPAAAVAAPPQFFDRTTSYAIATLIGVIGLLLGILVGYWLGTAPVQQSATPPASSSTTSSGGSAVQLPAGHPAVTIPQTTTP